MALAGYSGTPLVQKLGIKPGHRVLLARAPRGFAESELVGLPGDVELHLSARASSYDVIVLFATWLRDLEKGFPRLAKRLTPAGGLWVTWPKKAARVPTDLDDDVVREYGLSTGLVDNKVCAVTEVWSGQRFVVRLRNR